MRGISLLADELAVSQERHCCMDLILNIHTRSSYLTWQLEALLGLVYRVFQEECEILRESVPYVKLYRYNPKHLYPKLNGYGDNGQRSLKL